MATNKHATIRYHALDQCFRNPGRKYFIEDLVDCCNRAIYEFTGGVEGIKKRQVFDDIRFMESEQGWSVPLERYKDGKRVFYRYSNVNFTIGKEPLTENEANQIKETLATLARFKGMPQFEWVDEITARLKSSFSIKNGGNHIIEFEQNQYLQGLEFVSPLYNAIIYKKTLQISYFPFKAVDPTSYIISPYFLKQYNNRWFLFGWNHGEEFLMNLAFDRIKNLQDKNLPYIENTSIDFNSYFEDVVGVTIPLNAQAEKIILLVAKDLWPYLQTKPIHGSQKVLGHINGYVKLELELFINHELEALLFSFGNGIIVKSPSPLKERLLAKAKSLISLYDSSVQIHCTISK